MFYFLEDHGIENYTDGSTPYSAKTNHKLPMEELEKSSLILLKWLQSNHIKAKLQTLIIT